MDFVGVKMKDTKKKILEAGAELFMQNGFNKTTTRAIAARAGINESTFFRNYKTKDALLNDLLYVFTPGPEDVDISGLTNGEDLKADLEVFFYQNAVLHIKHIPVFRLALPTDIIYTTQRFAKIKGMVQQMGDYFNDLSRKGLAAEFNYYTLAEHMNGLVLVKASEFIVGEQFGVPAEQSARNFASGYAEYLARLLRTDNKATLPPGSEKATSGSLPTA